VISRSALQKFFWHSLPAPCSVQPVSESAVCQCAPPQCNFYTDASEGCLQSRYSGCCCRCCAPNGRKHLVDTEQSSSRSICLDMPFDISTKCSDLQSKILLIPLSADRCCAAYVHATAKEFICVGLNGDSFNSTQCTALIMQTVLLSPHGHVQHCWMKVIKTPCCWPEKQRPREH
jgi:hypothetical protein